LERGQSLEPALESLAERGRALRFDFERVLPRVLLVGEPWTILADGDPSYDLARRLARSGAQVEGPKAAEWLRYLLHEEKQNLTPLAFAELRLAPSFSGKGRRAQRAGVGSSGLAEADRALCECWSQLAAAAGISDALEDTAEVLSLAAPHYPEELRGGSGALETGRALRAVRDRTAHLILSVKPFGCLPSSGLSDGVLSILLRDSGVRFLVIETTGSADANVESRIEMALHGATLAALDESEGAAPDLQRTMKREAVFNPRCVRARS